MDYDILNKRKAHRNTGKHLLQVQIQLGKEQNIYNFNVHLPPKYLFPTGRRVPHNGKVGQIKLCATSKLGLRTQYLHKMFFPNM